MRVQVLGSGSRGNAMLVHGPDGALLLDCGFSKKALAQRLEAAQCRPEQIKAILVTHEHTDHASGVARVSRAWSLPVFCTHGTAQGAGLTELVGLNEIHPQQTVQLAGLEVQAYPVPHDAAEPVQFVFSDQSKRLGVLSDAGHVTPHMRDMLGDCDALLLEANHCPELLAQGPYPQALRSRVGGRFGHLNNGQTAELLGQIVRPRTRQIVLTHISEQNNTHERAMQVARSVLGDWTGQLLTAQQDSILHPITI